MSLAEMIQIADNYALGDPTEPAAVAEPTVQYQAPPQDGAGPFRGQARTDFRNKRNHKRPDYWYNHVAAVDQDQADAGNSQRQKNGDRPWEQKKP